MFAISSSDDQNTYVRANVLTGYTFVPVRRPKRVSIRAIPNLHSSLASRVLRPNRRERLSQTPRLRHRSPVEPARPRDRRRPRLPSLLCVFIVIQARFLQPSSHRARRRRLRDDDVISFAHSTGEGETASHTTPFAWCTPFLKDFSRRHSSPALPFQRLTGKTFD